MIRIRKPGLSLGAAAFLGLLLTAGCSSTQSTAAQDPAPPKDAMADASLAAGDGLGTQVFAVPATGTTRMAVLRQIDQAIQVAEAKLEEGGYDQWFASFDRVESDTAIAEADADQTDDEQPEALDAMVGVEVPVDPE
jgi:hypothetical protein